MVFVIDDKIICFICIKNAVYMAYIVAFANRYLDPQMSVFFFYKKNLIATESPGRKHYILFG